MRAFGEVGILKRRRGVLYTWRTLTGEMLCVGEGGMPALLVTVRNICLSIVIQNISRDFL
jgi:hypothetical protein